MKRSTMRSLGGVCAACAALLLGAGCSDEQIEDWIAPWDPLDGMLDWHYGSIALSLSTFAGAITANQPTQAESDRKAVETCGGDCTIVLRYSGRGNCGAIARASNFKYGVSMGTSLDEARDNAMAQCRVAGGVDCTPGLAMCND